MLLFVSYYKAIEALWYLASMICFPTCIQKPNFEAMINYVHKELDHDQELLKSLISASNKQKFGKEVIPSGQDFLTKVQESGWISPVDPNPLYDLLEEINRHDIVHKAKLEALVHGMFTINFIVTPTLIKSF